MVDRTISNSWSITLSMLMLMLMLALLVWPAMSAQAAVIAAVDRANVELNESFTLKITVDTAIDVEPDASALDEEFYVGTRSQLSNTTIVNGQISRSRTWTYVLMAKREDCAIDDAARGGRYFCNDRSRSN